jgi:hypothetical protein
MLILAAAPLTSNFPRILGLANSNFANYRSFQEDEPPMGGEELLYYQGDH